ncbi:MAG: 2-dehydropantoate 2-reductase [Firmicutes bacterium]|nr:2-dehydropantoate 2-reductase [Bacillota bacterium]
MKIAILGAGAMGSLFGGYLTAGGHDVWLIDTWAGHVNAMNSGGLVIEEAGGPRSYAVRAVSDPSAAGPSDLVIVFVKSYHTGAALGGASALFGEGTVALSLQNGVGQLEAMSAVIGRERVLLGTTAQGATMLGPGRVRHGGSGETIVGEPDGGVSPRVERIVEAFNASGIEARADAGILSHIWGKVIVNVGINALTALLGVRNGEILEIPEARRLMRTLVLEARDACSAKGIRLPYSDVAGKVESVAAATAQNRSSMLQDVSAGRQTEIDYINGAIVREAASLGVPAPANEIMTLLVRALTTARTSGKTAWRVEG